MILFFRRSERGILATKFLFSLEFSTMNNRHLVIPRYRVLKVCFDDRDSVTWEKRWFFYDWELEIALNTFWRAYMFWLPGSDNSCVYLYDGDREIASYSSDLFGKCGQPLYVDGCIRKECDSCIFSDGAYL